MSSKYEQVSDFIEQVGWGKYQTQSFFICGISWSTMLMWQCCISISLKELISAWNLSVFQAGVIGSCHTLGIFLGSFLWGYFGGTKGRLFSMHYLYKAYIVAGLLYMFSFNLWVICISSGLMGICNGGAQVLSGTLYLETLPKKQKWTFVLLSIFISFGGMFSYTCAVFLLYANLQFEIFRWIGGINVLVLIAVSVLLRFLYESPKFLVNINEDATCSVIEKIAERNNKQLEVKFDQNTFYVSINENQLEEYKAKYRFYELFSKEYRSQTITISLGLMTSDISYAALTAFMPILLSSVGSSTRSQQEIYLTILLQIFMGVPGSALSSYLVKTRLGKKWTVILGFAFCGLSVLFFLFSTTFAMVLISTCSINFFNQVGYAAFIAITAESYPAKIRSFAVGWANGWNKFGGVISPITIGYMLDQSNGTYLGVVTICICFCLVSVISLFLFEPDKNKVEDA